MLNSFVYMKLYEEPCETGSREISSVWDFWQKIKDDFSGI